MINDEFVDYEEALELKKLGFNESCFKVYTTSARTGDNDFSQLWWPDSVFDISKTQEVNNTWVTNEKSCTAPTYRQAFKWLSETDLVNWPYEAWVQPFLSPNPRRHEGFYWSRGEQVSVGVFDTHEEAELACLQSIIKHFKKTI